MPIFHSLGRHKAVLGMVHLQPLPGTPFYEQGTLQRTMDVAAQSARALFEGGADGCLVQTVDRAYSTKDESDPCRIAAISVIVQAIAQVTAKQFQIGVQLMLNATMPSLAVAKVAGGSFVRARALVGTSMTPCGLVEANPLAVMDYRSKIQAWDIAIVADVDLDLRRLGADNSVAAVAKYARQVGADAVALSDSDDNKTLASIALVRDRVPDVPIILAGHTNHENVERLVPAADGVFVGRCLERGGWGGQIDVDLVKKYVDIVRELEQ